MPSVRRGGDEPASRSFRVSETPGTLSRGFRVFAGLPGPMGDADRGGACRSYPAPGRRSHRWRRALRPPSTASRGGGEARGRVPGRLLLPGPPGGSRLRGAGVASVGSWALRRRGGEGSGEVPFRARWLAWPRSRAPSRGLELGGSADATASPGAEGARCSRPRGREPRARPSRGFGPRFGSVPLFLAGTQGELG